jgi:dihydroneopterin aldolase
MKVELHGLQLYGYHGVHAFEGRLGRTFLFDVELEVGERGADDRIGGAVDYSAVARAVREVNDRRFDLLEALACAVADDLLARFQPESVRVRVRKPGIRAGGASVDWAAVTVERP